MIPGTASNLPPANYSPLVIQAASLKLWLRGDTGFTASTGVWLDQSGQGNNTSPQSVTRPTASTINSKASVLFPGTANQGLITPSISLGSFTIGLVAKISAAGYFVVHASDLGANGGYLYSDTNTTAAYARSSTLSDRVYSTGLKNGVTRSLIWTFGGSTLTNRLYINGELASLATATGNNPGAGPTAGAIYIGASQAGGGVGPLNIGDLAVWGVEFGYGDVQRLYKYHNAYGWGV